TRSKPAGSPSRSTAPTRSTRSPRRTRTWSTDARPASSSSSRDWTPRPTGSIVRCATNECPYPKGTKMESTASTALRDEGLDPRAGVGAVENALRLLQLYRQRDVLGVSETARRLGVGRSTAHRLLRTLRAHGFV